MESETETVISKKIRIYPENEVLWEQALNIYRRAYNLTIELFKPKVCLLLDLTMEGQKPSSELRSLVVKWCKHEADYNGVGYDVNLLQAAYKKACDTRSAIIKKRKRKEKADYSFMSRNEATQYFIAPRLSKGKKIFPRFLNDFHWSEPCPDSAIGRTVVVKRENGQWFANVQSIMTTQESKAENLKIVALDPGVRTFQTAFSEVDSVHYGSDFVGDKLAPLMLELDSLLSQRDRLRNQDQSQQWINDRLKENGRKINKIKAHQKNLVEDLHRRIAYDLVTHYDLILLPTFETKQMAKKSNETRKRYLRRKTVRGMLGLAHYKFKLTLKWMAKKYGKTVLDVNESYTSKTLWDGSMLDNLGGKASILFQGIRVNRDQHGARNILIRFLTKVLDSLGLREAHSLITTNRSKFKQNFGGFGGLK
jgi:IS605 OrfB family transposase